MNTYLLLCLCVCAYEYERHISDPASIRPRRHQRVHWKIGFAGKKYVPLGTVTESTGKNHIPVGTVIGFTGKNHVSVGARKIEVKEELTLNPKDPHAPYA